MDSEHNPSCFWSVIPALPSLTRHYTLLDVIGVGGNSEVYLCQKKQDSTQYACKIPDDGVEELVWDEAKIMSAISKHPNESPFLEFHGLYEHLSKPVIVSEILVDSKSLSGLVAETYKEIASIIRPLLEQLIWLHDRGSNHGDVGAHNVIYNTTRVVFVDVGNYKYNYNTNISITAEELRTTPEYLLDAATDMSGADMMSKKDVFDFGDLVRELIGKPPPAWQEFLMDRRVNEISSEYGWVADIINAASNLDISARATAQQLLGIIPDDA